MGITQQIGASSLIKPGVIDNTAARPASPYEGQVIFQKDTDQLLVWNGTAWVIPNAPAQNPTGLEFITSGTFSGTALDGIFTSTYNNYRIVVSSITASSGVLINFNFRNTSNATNSDNNYYSAGRRYDSGTNYDFSQGPNTYGTTAINATTVGQSSFTMDIFQPRTANMTTVSLAGVGGISAISTVQSSMTFYAYDLFAGIVFSASGGNTITDGNYAVYGYRKAV